MFGSQIRPYRQTSAQHVHFLLNLTYETLVPPGPVGPTIPTAADAYPRDARFKPPFEAQTPQPVGQEMSGRKSMFHIHLNYSVSMCGDTSHGSGCLTADGFVSVGGQAAAATVQTLMGTLGGPGGLCTQSGTPSFGAPGGHTRALVRCPRDSTQGGGGTQQKPDSNWLSGFLNIFATAV